MTVLNVKNHIHLPSKGVLPCLVCCVEVVYVHTEVSQQNACLCQTVETKLKLDSLVFYARVLLKQGVQLLLVLKHLQHLPLQLDGRLVQHLIADHQGDLVSQTLASNLWFGESNAKLLPGSVYITKISVKIIQNININIQNLEFQYTSVFSLCLCAYILEHLHYGKSSLLMLLAVPRLVVLLLWSEIRRAVVSFFPLFLFRAHYICISK